MFFWIILNVVEISCWQQRQNAELHGWQFSVQWLFLVYKFFVVMDGICANDLFQVSAFSKGYNEVLRVFLQLWFACNMCQCFVRISFRFDNAQLYVNDNSIHYHDVFVGGAVVLD